MKTSELRVGRHVWIGGRYGDEGYIVDTDPHWSRYKWASRGSQRFFHGDGKCVAVAVKRRGYGEDERAWLPDVAVLSQVQDYDEHLADIEMQRRAAKGQRQRDQQVTQDRQAREKDYESRLDALLGADRASWFRLGSSGVELAESVFEAVLRKAEGT